MHNSFFYIEFFGFIFLKVNRSCFFINPFMLTFDFAMCNSVIQHINSDDVHAMVLPELVRVIRPGGKHLVA